ncbi:hypothetical protein D9758_016374 [Tetrapyrgos nigripes]|uniref:Uncharacterized protein n=1 Tax=Tetrapyrgos nigripes TaxID=182062 RepID=A0A8H5FJI0_9AGAR|nr:hypothetical protein D9758_016374 [Tetrapyrgos nigripes]
MDSPPPLLNHPPIQMFSNAQGFSMNECTFQVVGGNVNNYSSGSDHAELIESHMKEQIVPSQSLLTPVPSGL